MCYGSDCPYEINSGPNTGECGKPEILRCPDLDPDTEWEDDDE